MRRPVKIRFSAIDPMDEALLTESILHYDPRVAAHGTYSRYHKRCALAAKAGASHILEGREPLVLTELIYA